VGGIANSADGSCTRGTTPVEFEVNTKYSNLIDVAGSRTKLVGTSALAYIMPRYAEGQGFRLRTATARPRKST